jgi:hypothetical protein
MAPRAGFEVGRKFLSAQIVATLDDLDTPSDTPRVASLESEAATWSRACFCNLDYRAGTDLSGERAPGFEKGLLVHLGRESVGNLSGLRCLCALEPPGYLSPC